MKRRGVGRVDQINLVGLWPGWLNLTLPFAGCSLWFDRVEARPTSLRA